MKFHGNWCGPNWTAGQVKPCSELTEEDLKVPAVDELDEACKWHDVQLHYHPDQANKINEQFVEKAKTLGLKGEIAAYLVKNFGPSPSPVYVTPKKVRRNIVHVLQGAKRQKTKQGYCPAGRSLFNLLSGKHAMGHDVHMSEAVSHHHGEGVKGGAPSMGFGAGAEGETPIAKQKVHYGLPDCTTVALPFTTYFTAVTNSNQNVFNFYFRLNSPVDPLISTTTTGTPGTAISPGLYRTKWWDNNDQLWPATALTYPQTNGATDAPQWRPYFDKLYDVWTCIGSEWSMEIANLQRQPDRDVVVVYGPETTSSVNNARTFPGNIPIANYEFYPGLKWEVIRSRSRSGGLGCRITSIGGKWKPGQVSHNVQNDEDIKTWTPTNNSVPSLTERMMVGIAQAAFNDGDACRALAIKLNITYYVQYRDLKVQVYYPVAGQSTIAATFPTDILESA